MIRERWGDRNIAKRVANELSRRQKYEQISAVARWIAVQPGRTAADAMRSHQFALAMTADNLRKQLKDGSIIERDSLSLLTYDEKDLLLAEYWAMGHRGGVSDGGLAFLQTRAIEILRARTDPRVDLTTLEHEKLRVFGEHSSQLDLTSMLLCCQ